MESNAQSSQGLAPSVPAEEIDALLARCRYESFVVPGTTTTLVAVVLDTIVLEVGHSSCVSPENFDADIGYKYAREDAEKRARAKLWELKGWELWQSGRAQDDRA